MLRAIYHKINQLLTWFPVVVILGARQCGKTTLAKMLRPDWRYLDLDNPADLARFSNEDPVFYLHHYNRNLIIDEAQSYPPIFDILRGVVDQERNEKNQTGKNRAAVVGAGGGSDWRGRTGHRRHYPSH